MNNICKKIRDASLALMLIAGIGSCSQQTKEQIKENSPIEITVGESARVGDHGLNSNCIIYAGFPSPKIFSLATCGYQGVNIYYPNSSEIINYQGERFQVLEVTPEKIILKPARK